MSLQMRGIDAGIDIRGLYKIFGAGAQQYVEAVRSGTTKAELMDKHGAILGLKDISIAMPAGGIQVIMGLSGSGKSTLIRHINRLIEPTVGEVLIGGTDVTKMNPMDLREFRRHQTAMVFQKFALLPHRTVLANVGYGLEVQGLAPEIIKDRAMRWIERVGLKGFEGRYPNQLSGGMQQRVGLARALTNDAPILLMDEAFSALDPLIRVDMQGVLLDLQKELKKTVVFITHDLDEALRLGDRIAILRDGAVIQQGTGQDIVLRPADYYIFDFVRDVNRGRVIKVESVMNPLIDEDDLPQNQLSEGSTLDAAMKMMSDADCNMITICNASGKPTGIVDMNAAVRATVNPATVPTDRIPTATAA